MGEADGLNLPFPVFEFFVEKQTWSGLNERRGKFLNLRSILGLVPFRELDQTSLGFSAFVRGSFEAGLKFIIKSYFFVLNLGTFEFGVEFKNFGCLVIIFETKLYK